jgi:hypothetical protein
MLAHPAAQPPRPVPPHRQYVTSSTNPKLIISNVVNKIEREIANNITSSDYNSVKLQEMKEEARSINVRYK